MDFFKKSNTIFDNNLSGTFEKPRVCPCCGDKNDATVTEKSVLPMGKNCSALVTVCQCTACDAYFLVANYRDVGKSPDAIFGCMYPFGEVSYENEILSHVSPRFISMYRQALRCESIGDRELAATGFRSALEILVKDYAIQELSEDADKVAKLSLADAINKYLSDSDLMVTADVVRILGNDYTHYKRKYPELDYEILKNYMEIFIKQIESFYLIKHPPVSRSE